MGFIGITILSLIFLIANIALRPKFIIDYYFLIVSIIFNIIEIIVGFGTLTNISHSQTNIFYLKNKKKDELISNNKLKDN